MKRAEWTINDWINELPPEEQGYVRRCFRDWQGNNGGEQPTIPIGISRAKADILRYHTKALLDTTNRKRKCEEFRVISFRASEELEKKLAFDASEIGINKSIFIRTCIEVGRPLVRGHPKLINFFSDAVIPK